MPKARAHLIAPAILQRARDFRHPLTPPEAKVWQAVRKRQLGFKIRRQHPIGRFIADFRLGDTSCPLCRPIRARRRGW
jgi:very-short-patch-repair endonuclease